MAKKISEKIVAALPVPPKGNKLHYFSAATLQGKRAPSGFAVRVTSAGTKSFVWFHRVGGTPYLETLGRWDENASGGSLTVLGAIIAAKARAEAISTPGSGADPRPDRTRRLEDGNKPAGETIGDLLDKFGGRYVDKDAKLRTAKIIKRTFERLVKPAIGEVGVYDLRRSQVVEMLDTIADENGPVMADRTLAYIRKAFNWRAINDDDFRSPIVKGMARTKTKDRARSRILSDDEIRDLWASLDAMTEPSCYSAYMKTLLHTATRLKEAANMRWDEIDSSNGVWTIPGSRHKSKKDHAIPLTNAVRKLIGTRPKDYAKRPFVFSTTGGTVPFSGHSKAKATLDKKIAARRKADDRGKVERWTPHDLRRTARSLMSRAGVSEDHAERAIGHVIPGVRGVYDRHDYLPEKKKVLEALDRLVTQILDPPPANVENLADRKRRRAGA